MPVLKLSIFRSVTTDYIIFCSLVFPFISLIVIIVTVGNPLLIGLLTILSAATLVIAGIRFVRILAIINENQMVDAIVTYVYFYRGRGTISFCFTYNGESYHTSLYVIRTKPSTVYKPGDKIQVLVDWNDPRKALIADLYTNVVDSQ